MLKKNMKISAQDCIESRFASRFTPPLKKYLKPPVNFRDALPNAADIRVSAHEPVAGGDRTHHARAPPDTPRGVFPGRPRMHHGRSERTTLPPPPPPPPAGSRPSSSPSSSPHPRDGRTFPPRSSSGPSTFLPLLAASLSGGELSPRLLGRCRSGGGPCCSRGASEEGGRDGWGEITFPRLSRHLFFTHARAASRHREPAAASMPVPHWG